MFQSLSLSVLIVKVYSCETFRRQQLRPQRDRKVVKFFSFELIYGGLRERFKNPCIKIVKEKQQTYRHISHCSRMEIYQENIVFVLAVCVCCLFHSGDVFSLIDEVSLPFHVFHVFMREFTYISVCVVSADFWISLSRNLTNVL